MRANGLPSKAVAVPIECWRAMPFTKRAWLAVRRVVAVLRETGFAESKDRFSRSRSTCDAPPLVRCPVLPGRQGALGVSGLPS